MIACGKNFTVIQNEKDEVYVCGCNAFGQLGLGNNEDRYKFEKVKKNFGKIKKIACGGYHTIIQNEKDKIYVCGKNLHGQLGLGDNKNRFKFEKVEKNFGEIKNIACGRDYMVIQSNKNYVYVFGLNDYNQLCLGDDKKIECDFGEIKYISCGNTHIVIQNAENDVYVYGNNWSGQLGLNDNGIEYIDRFKRVDYNLGKIKITCGGYHTIIQNEKNEIYVCGSNWFGQLGLGDNENRNKFERINYNFGEIKNIVCGEFYTVIQNEKNEVYVCGLNAYGQFGLGDKKDRDNFEKVEYEFGEIKNIACGENHIVIQNDKNEIYVCGKNLDGQLGLCDKGDRYIFEKIHYDYIFEKIYNFELKLNVEEILL